MVFDHSIISRIESKIVIDHDMLLQKINEPVGKKVIGECAKIFQQLMKSHRVNISTMGDGILHQSPKRTKCNTKNSPVSPYHSAYSPYALIS
jgi:hypothetical protein